MQSSIIRQAQYGLAHDSSIHPPRPRQSVGYKTYKSKFGPQYKIGAHLFGINVSHLTRFAVVGGTFGVAGGIFALFFLSGVPRVERDILQKIPVIGNYFVHEVAPEDNPF